ncbi:MAG: hypothetical protein V1724_02010, partial [Chloroflexota bacterium]
LLFAVRRKLRLSVGAVLVAALLSGVSLVLAAQLEVFTTTVSPVAGPTSRPGRQLSSPDTSTTTPSSGPAASSSGIVAFTGTDVGRYVNNINKAHGSITPASSSVTPANGILVPEVSTVGPILNTVHVVTQASAPAIAGAAPASSPATALQGVVDRTTYASPVTPETTALAPSRAILPSTQHGGAATVATVPVAEARTLLAARVQGLPGTSTAYPHVVEARSFHIEADGRIPVVQRVVQPIVSYTPRRFGWSVCAAPNRGGTIEIGWSEAKPSDQDPIGATRSVTPLTSSSGRRTNTIFVFSAAATPSAAVAGPLGYVVAPHVEAMTAQSYPPLLPVDSSVVPTGSTISPRTEGLTLTPAVVGVTPALATLAGTLAPCVSPLSQDAVTGVTQTLEGTAWPPTVTPPTATPTPTPTPTSAQTPLAPTPTPTALPSLSGLGLLLMAMVFGVVVVLALRARARREGQT